MSEPAITEVDESGAERSDEDGRETPVVAESVMIKRAPGFEAGGFTVDGFSPGVNVVYGENAAGKTTLSEAIRWSLWPDEAPTSAEVSTQLAYEGDQRRVELRGGMAENFVDGAAADPIPVPSLHGGRRYSLALHELLQEETDDGEFATVIQRESTGGFDIDAVGESFDLEEGASPSTRNLSATQEAEKAIQRVEDLRQETPDLEEEQEELSQIEERLADAEAARERVKLLKTAIEYAEARADYEEKVEELKEFPQELGEFNGKELDRLDRLDEQIRTQKGRERDAAETYREASQTLAATELPEDGITDDDLESLRQYQNQLDDAEDDRDRLKRELSGAKEERQKIRGSLPLDLDEETLRSVETDDLDELRSFVEKVTEVEGKKQVEAAIKEWLEGESDRVPDRSTLEDGRGALENWLTAPPERATDEEEDRGIVWAAVTAGVLAAIAGVFIAFISNPLGLLLTLLGLGIAAYAVLVSGGEEDATENPRATHAETFRQTGLKEPAAWEADAVRERLSEIRERLGDVELDTQEARKREELLARYDVDELEEELEIARKRLRARFDTEVHDDIDLAVVVERVERWQAADEEVCRKQAVLSEAEDQITENRENFLAAVAPYTTGTYDYEVETAADAAGVIESLEERRRDFENAKQRLAEVRGTVTEARSELDRFTSEREALFADRGLDPGNRDRLEKLCEQLSDYEAAVEAKNKAKTTLENRREDLRDHSRYDEEIEERDKEDLQDELRDKQETAAEYDRLLQKKTELENEIENAKTSTEIADAVQQRDQALAELEAELERDVAEAVTDSLLEFVEAETVTSNQEPVFRRADELLRRVTDGQFELRLEDGTFRAYDTGEDRRVDLNDLFSGTRVQVLLAVRVAFVEHREQETAPPLLLDETLAPFDDRRAETVLDTVIDLARQGRQVFYFTARTDERERWRRRLEESGVKYGFQHLTAADDHNPVAEPPALDTADAVDVPVPDEDDHEEYRQKLDVPTFDPREGAASADLWYLTEDPEILYSLRIAGIERWGHLRSLLEVGGIDGLLSENARERVRQHGAALEVFVEAYTVGRGKPVDREVLEASGAVSGKFIDEASDLADRVAGKPEAVLDGLSNEVNYFREEKVEELRAYLREEGYIDPTPTRSDEQIYAEVVDVYCQSGLSPEDAAEATSGLLSRISAAPDPGVVGD
jgi:DNA repair exonuclease SbcCD ATPase subunit